MWLLILVPKNGGRTISEHQTYIGAIQKATHIRASDFTEVILRQVIKGRANGFNGRINGTQI